MIATEMLFGLLILLLVPILVQATDYNKEYNSGSIIQKNALTNLEIQDTLILLRLQNVRIVLKDRSIKNNCKVVEINNYWIVYEKDGSLHDLLIEKIKRIEIRDYSSEALYFDENNKPFIKQYN